MSLDIKFFKDTKGGKRLGGGYITSGGLKTNFSVWKSDKSKYGFNLSLPYRKNEADGTVVNEVSFTTQAVGEEANKYIAAQLNGSVSDDTAPRVVTESIGNQVSGQQTSVDVKNRVRPHGTRPPF